MISKEKYLVYDKEKDCLNLNGIDHDLVRSLMQSPDIMYEEIVSRYFESSANKTLFLDRLEEIAYFYWNTGPPVMVALGRNQIVKLFEVLEILKRKLKKSRTKRKSAASSKTKNPQSLKDYFKSPDNVATVLIEFSKNKSKTRIEIVAKTLRSFISRKYQENLSAPDLTYLLIDIGILSEEDFNNYSDYLKKSRLAEIKEDSSLLAKLAHES